MRNGNIPLCFSLQRTRSLLSKETLQVGKTMKPLYCRHLLWRRHYTQPFQESTNVRCQPDGPRLQETWWLFSAVRVVDYSIHHNRGSFKRSVCARQRGNEIILDQHISFDWLPGPIFVRVGRSDGGDWPLYYAECRGGGPHMTRLYCRSCRGISSTDDPFNELVNQETLATDSSYRAQYPSH